MNLETSIKTTRKWLQAKRAHIIWKSLKRAHLNFCPIKTDLSGNTVWPLASDFQKLAKMDHFWHFYLTLVQTLLAMLNETFSVIFKHRASYVYFLSNFRLQQIKYTLGISQPFSSPILELKTSFRIPESNSSTKVISQGIRDRHCHKISTSILQFCVWLYPFARIDVTIACTGICRFLCCCRIHL